MLKYFNSQPLGWGLSRDFMENQTTIGFFSWYFRVKETNFRRREHPEACGAAMALVELAGDDGVLDQKLEGNDIEGVLVGGLEDDRAGGSGPLDLEPAGGADAPTVAGFEAGKTELRHGSAEIVAQRLGGFKEWGVDDAADGMDAIVFGPRLATARAVKARHGFAAADVERLAENVFSAILDGFDTGHRFYCKAGRPTAGFAD
jgi:hypothetical protein